MVRLKFYFPSLPASPSWLQGRTERGAGKPPEAFGCSQQAAAVARGGGGRGVGREWEKKKKSDLRMRVDEDCYCVNVKALGTQQREVENTG